MFRCNFYQYLIFKDNNNFESNHSALRSPYEHVQEFRQWWKVPSVEDGLQLALHIGCRRRS